jgi:hypothetical protein
MTTALLSITGGDESPMNSRGKGSIQRSAWKKNSTKFAVASIRRRRGVRASGWGYAGFLSTIVDTLAASVARNRGKRAQVVAFQLPENFRTSLSYATGVATTSVFAAAALCSFRFARRPCKSGSWPRPTPTCARRGENSGAALPCIATVGTTSQSSHVAGGV